MRSVLQLQGSTAVQGERRPQRRAPPVQDANAASGAQPKKGGQARGRRRWRLTAQASPCGSPSPRQRRFRERLFLVAASQERGTPADKSQAPPPARGRRA